MQHFFKCDYCDYISDGDTIGDKMDMEDHENTCKYNPKNKIITIKKSIPWDSLRQIHKKFIDGYIIMELLAAGIPVKGIYILEGVTKGTLKRHTDLETNSEVFVWTGIESPQTDGNVDCTDLKGDNAS